MNNLGIRTLGFVTVAIALGLSATASAQRGGGRGGGGWSGSHGGGYGGGGGGSRGGGGGGGFSRDSSGSRSNSHPGVSHNVTRESADRRVTIEGMPHAGHYDPHGWQWNHHDLTHDGFRWGYYHYDRWWRDSSFLFGFYVFDPIGAWVYSPWYYYPCLPPYIAEDHVLVEPDEPQDWTDGEGDFTEYQWLTPDKNSADSTDLDYALQDLVASFLDRNNDAMSRLSPRAGRVAIYTDGHYSYSLNAANFYDTFKDGATGPRTTRYKILDVKTNGHDIANVEAEQDYTDPWGKEAVVFHTFRMVQEGPNVVIRSFGTYKNRPW